MSRTSSKNTILSSLRSIASSALNECILKYKIFSAVPIKDLKEFNREVVGTILDILEGVLEKLICPSNTEKDDTAAKSDFSNADGYNTFPYLLSVYKYKKIRQRMSIVLERFYNNLVVLIEKKNRNWYSDRCLRRVFNK
jgi:hypothetical protein